MNNPPTVSNDILVKLLLNPLRNSRSSLIDSGKVLNGVMDLYRRLGDEASANQIAETLQDLADTKQRLDVLIELIGSEGA